MTKRAGLVLIVASAAWCGGLRAEQAALVPGSGSRPEALNRGALEASRVGDLPRPGVVDAELLERLRAGDGRVAVIVQLREPRATSDGTAGRVAAIAVAQESVLAALPPTSFVLRHRLRNVAGLSGEADATALAGLARHPDVLRVYEDAPVYPLLAEGKPLMRADYAQAQGLTGAGQTVAVIDTGVNGGHPDFAGVTVVNGWDFGDGDPDSSDDCSCGGHGTAVAGIVARPDGVAPSADLVALKIASCASACRSYGSSIAMAIDWCVTNRAAHGITVINISFGGGHFSVDCDAADPVTASAARRAVAAGMVVFAASGNEGYATGIAHPACLSDVIAVGAVYDADVGPLDTGFCRDASSRADRVICYSNDSDTLDLLAPSQCATTTGRSCFNGTSAASPYAAAGAALLREWNPNLTVDELRDLMIGTGDPVTDPKSGRTHPRVNLQRALTETPGTPRPRSGDAHFEASSPSRNPDGSLDLAWQPAAGAAAYDVFEGSLTTPWAYSHDRVVACDLPAWQLSLDGVNSSPGDRYYLVSPRTVAGRTCGVDSEGQERPLPASCQVADCTREPCQAQVLGDFPVVLEPARSIGPCDPSIVGYIVGDASSDQYLLIDLDVVDWLPGVDGEVISWSLDLFYDGTDYVRVLLLESCAAESVLARVRVIEYPESSMGALVVDGSARLDPWGTATNWAWADVSPDGVSSPAPPYPYLASLTSSSAGAPLWAQVTLRHAYRFDEPNFVQWRSLWTENLGDAPIDVRLRVRAAGPLLGPEITSGPITAFPVAYGALGGGPYDDGDAHAWFDAIPTLTSCLPEGQWLPWLTVTARDGAAWYDTFWFDNSGNCWPMDFAASVAYLSECCN